MKRLLLLLATLLFAGIAAAAVNINTATKEELDVLPGIGPVKAQAIIDYRKQNGPFKTPEDIMKVRGIKEGEFAKLKGEISVSGPSSAPAAAAKAAAPTKAAVAKAEAPAKAAVTKAEAPAKSAAAKVETARTEPKAEKAAKAAEAKVADAKSAKDKAKPATSGTAAKSAPDAKTKKDTTAATAAKVAKDEKALNPDKVKK